MKFVSVVLLACAVGMAAAAPADEPREYNLDHAPALFEKFIEDHSRQYKDDEDRRVHYEAFVESLKQINELNKQQPDATFGITSLADYTEEERKNMFGLRVPEDN